MKKVLALLSLLMLLSAAGCTASNQTYYEQAQLYLGCGDYTAAAELFSQLGEYRDSADYALYAAGLQAIKSGQYALAQTNLMEVDPFKSSGRYLRYLEALMLENLTLAGLNLERWKREFGDALEETRAREIRKLKEYGLIEIANGFLRLTPAGLELQDSVVLELMDD